MANNQARPVKRSLSAPTEGEKDNKFGYLINAEMSVEGNFNMIGDGIMNNVAKPSMLERLEELEQQQLERHKTNIVDDTRERHKADYLASKEER